MQAERRYLRFVGWQLGTSPSPPLSLVPRLAPDLWFGRFFPGGLIVSADDELESVLRSSRTIAVVGWSPDPERPSHGVARFLFDRGYRVIPVNPGQAGKVALGETVRANLSSIPEPVDMIDIFRRPDAVLPLVQEAIRELPGLKTVWMQLGVSNAEAASLARSHGIIVIENRCPKIEIIRLGL